MQHIKKTIGLLICLTILIGTACSHTPAKISKANTEIVATEVAAATETQAAMPPTETISPPTATIAMPDTTATPITLPTKLRYETTNTPQPIVKIAATATLAKTAAQLISYNPGSNVNVNPKQTINLTIVLKNTGAFVWNRNYRIVHTGGTQLSQHKQYNLAADVSYGGTASLVISITAPDKHGTYTQNWGFLDANGMNILNFSYNVIVGSNSHVTSIPTKGSQLDYMCSDRERSIQQGQGCETFCKNISPYKNPCYYLGTLNPTITLTPIRPTATATVMATATATPTIEPTVTLAQPTPSVPPMPEPATPIPADTEEPLATATTTAAEDTDVPSA